MNIFYGRCAKGHFINFLHFHFLHSVIPTSQLRKVVRWDVDDAAIHDRLRMRKPNIT
jgi:hypothetical protein